MLGKLKELWLKIAGAHRSADDTAAARVFEFLLPRPTRGFFLRMGVVALLAVLVFSFVLIPCFINGESMLPTYPSHGFTFCWRPSFWFRKPKRGDVVIVSFYGHKTLLLKRLVAFEGDTVAFRKGVLLVNGQELEGDWEVKGPCDWELPERTVEPGNIYVVGDNRSMSINEHIFGQVSAKRIEGAPLW